MTVTKKALFILTDEEGNRLSVEVEECGTFLNLTPEGYGNPVSLDFYNGRLRLLVNTDPDEEEPVIIDLESARENEE